MFYYTQKIIDKGFKNPNGVDIPLTFYVNTYANIFEKLKQRYDEGHEIGIHTILHATGVHSSYEEFKKEIVGSRKVIL